jgi:hypothetical protein
MTMEVLETIIGPLPFLPACGCIIAVLKPDTVGRRCSKKASPSGTLCNPIRNKIQFGRESLGGIQK